MAYGSGGAATAGIKELRSDPRHLVQQGKAKQAIEPINQAVELGPANAHLRKIQEVIKTAAP